MQISTEECGFVRVFCCRFLLTRTCGIGHTNDMKNARFESSSDVVRWLQREAAGLWPALLGSLSFRRSPCVRENCPACRSGEQHPSFVLYGRLKAKLRVDTTVVQSDIHHPTDNTLLWDVVRVVTRLVVRLAEVLGLRRIKGFCDRTRAARRRMYEIQRMTTRQRHAQQTETYRELIAIAEEVVEGART